MRQVLVGLSERDENVWRLMETRSRIQHVFIELLTRNYSVRIQQ